MASTTIPALPSDAAIDAVMAQPNGTRELIKDLYKALITTATELSNHIGSSMTSHEDLEVQATKMASEIDSIKTVVGKEVDLMKTTVDAKTTWQNCDVALAA